MAEIPVFENREQVETNLGVTGFAEAASKSESLLSVAGNALATGAAMQQAEIEGTRSGTNPDGRTPLVITASDQQFYNAYRNQANASLTLQASTLINSGIAELQKAPKLTPELLDDFNNNVQSGLENIVQAAPAVDRERLRVNLSAEMLQANNKLQTKLLEQQQAEMADTHGLYVAQATENIFSFSAEGDDESAAQALSDLVQSNQQAVDNGIMTAKAAWASDDAAYIQYLTGKEFKKANEARINGNLSGYLEEFSKGPRDGMTEAEWVKVGSNVLKLVGQQDRLSSRYQSELWAKGMRAIADGSINQDMINHLEENMEPAAFDQFMVSYLGSSNKAAQQQARVDFIIGNKKNPTVLADATPTDLNAAWTQEYQNKMLADENIDEWTAQTIAASEFNAPIPSFVNRVSALAKTGDVTSLEAALWARDTINNQSPLGMSTLDAKSNAILDIYKDTVGFMAKEKAAENATNRVLRTDAREEEALKLQWADTERKTFGASQTPNNLERGASKIFGRDVGQFRDPTQAAINIKRMFKDNFYLYKDETQAIERTRKELNSMYGLSSVNSATRTLFGNPRKFYELYPIEQIMAYQGVPLDNNSLTFVHAQISEQVQEYVMQANESIKDSGIGVKYQIVTPPSISLEEYQAAKSELEKEVKSMRMGSSPFFSSNIFSDSSTGPRRNKINALRETIRIFENPGKSILQVTYDNGAPPDNYLMTITADDRVDNFASRPVYNVGFQDLSGVTIQPINLAGFGGQRMLYIPNPEALSESISNMIAASGDSPARSVRTIQRNLKIRADREKARASLIEKGLTTGTHDSGLFELSEQQVITADDLP